MSSTVAVAISPSSSHTVATVRIVDLRPGDTATVRSVFDALSDQSRYLRFHTAMPRISEPMLRLLADVRPGQHVAHVAETDDGDGIRLLGSSGRVAAGVSRMG